MKYYLLLLLLLTTNFLAQGQKYSSILSDTQIISFITWIVTKDGKKTDRYLNAEIVKNDTSLYLFNDSAKFRAFDNLNIFQPKYHLDTLLTEKDANFFIKQINSQKATKWEYIFPYTVLVDYPKITKDKKLNFKHLQEFNKKHPTVWRYSLPLFSLDYSKVILIESYSCGTACGGVSFILYERKENNWRKVREFNQLSN